MSFPSFSTGDVLTASDMNAVGLWKINTFTAAGTNRALVIDNIFTSDYENYRIVGKLRSTINVNALFFQLLDTTGTAQAINYFNTAYGQDYANGGTTFTTATLTTVCYVGYIPNSTIQYGTFSFDILGPRIAADATSWQGQITGLASGFSYLGGAFHGQRTVADASRGIRFDNAGAGNLTGTVRVYGYRD